MKRASNVFSFLAAVLLFIALPYATRAQAQSQAQIPFPEGPGKETFLRICSNCHGPDNVIGRGETADDWTETLNKMIMNGAKGSDDEFGEILDYLVKNFGPPPDKVNVNKSTAFELRNWLNFSDKQADAVVQYRKQNGDFKSLDDLKKVTGLDAKMLDSKKDHISF